MKIAIGSFFKYFGIALIGFLAPLKFAFLFTIIIVTVDTITGIMKAGKEDVKNIQSRKMFALVPKLIFYLLLVVVAHSVALLEPQIPFVKLALIGIGWIEIKSIDENFNSLFGYSFLDKVLEGIKSINQIQRHKDDIS